MFNATPKVSRRLSSRKIFDSLDVDGSGTISLTELSQAVSTNPSLLSFFSRPHGGVVPPASSASNLFAQLDSNGDGSVTWFEFLDHLTALEEKDSRPPVDVTGEELDKIFAKRGHLESVFDGDSDLAESSSSPSSSSVAARSSSVSSAEADVAAGESYVVPMVLDVSVYEGELFVELLSLSSPPRSRPGHALLSIHPTLTAPLSVAADFVSASKTKGGANNGDGVPSSQSSSFVGRLGDAAATRAVAEEVRKAVVEACARSSESLWGARTELLDKLAELGREIRDGEAKTTSRRRPSNKTDKTEAPPPPPVEEDGTKYKDDDVDRLLKSYGERPPSAVTLSTTLTAIADEIAALRKKRSPPSPPPLRPSSSADPTEDRSSFKAVDTDGDGTISRDEWRDWSEGEVARMTAAIQEREDVVAENRRLRKAIVGGGADADGDDQNRYWERQEAAWDRELMSLEAEITKLERGNANLEAEVRIAEKFKDEVESGRR